jgi:hypothetical protein
MMSTSDKQMMEIAVNALFTYDHAGRMLRVNEPNGDVAPRFFLGRTRDGHLWRFRQDVPTDVVRQLESLCLREPVVGDVRQRPMHFDEMRGILEASMPIQKIYIGPEYYFPEVIPSTRLAQRITCSNADCLKHYFAWMIPWLDEMPPVFAVVVDGHAVSMCFSSRTTPLADEAGVNTAEGYRGKGYAPAAVAAWASAIREQGRTPLYGTT